MTTDEPDATVHYHGKTFSGSLEEALRAAISDDQCTCPCHVVPGVRHIVACCDQPPVAETEESSV